MLVDSSFKAKLSDFGLSSRRRLGAVGTPYWMAPELLFDESPTRASDVYALGVVIFEIMTRRLPYEGEDLEEVLTQVRKRLCCNVL